MYLAMPRSNWTHRRVCAPVNTVQIHLRAKLISVKLTESYMITPFIHVVLCEVLS